LFWLRPHSDKNSGSKTQYQCQKTDIRQ
jgi:hypothetical protein